MIINMKLSNTVVCWCITRSMRDLKLRSTNTQQ